MSRLKGHRHFVVLALLLVFADTATAKFSGGGNIPRADLAAYDSHGVVMNGL